MVGEGEWTRRLVGDLYKERENQADGDALGWPRTGLLTLLLGDGDITPRLLHFAVQRARDARKEKAGLLRSDLNAER
jgi:hypothetical protein